MVTRDALRARAQQGRADVERQLEATRAQLEATNERLTARSGRNLVSATVIGLIGGGAMVVSLLVVKELFMVLAGALVLLAALELSSALRHAGRDIPRIPTGVVAVVAVPAAYYGGMQAAWFAVLGGSALVALWRLGEQLLRRTRSTGRELLLDVGLGAFVQIYVTFLGAFAIRLVAEEGGQFWALSFLILVIVVDTGAYVSGLTWGKHPMAPRISPKKTWEGFAGAAVAGVVVGVLLALLLLGQPWWVGAVFGAVVLLTATLGDLAESLIKRDIGIKDMSSWLPGHGGFLDRLDSILPSAAAAYVLYFVFAH
ncbi:MULTISPECIES: phosphatidate cytidylyltransferase [unclassified Rathayibacter]|uniref:phosphatidate cytidylyltransferase n=1 Tax=unclassified Rathayibacter TaxID=2609250 RepID=UPI001FB4979D|nr:MULTISPECIES: phosphatidate cytidylyltransferase [unclassified Rathayibacter]MCJ1673196.1 phosphatidate cytidylyltransferase [Rathayibacter sp. VKM Ac-2929]MCJ1682695.1 phosphatidate cytidylyltransferase [Rathayibacter sp. VKM Ac-2928]